MSTTERVSRETLDSALPYQVAVKLSDGEGTDGTLRRLYCANLNIGPGHSTAVVHELERFMFCFANLVDASASAANSVATCRWRRQFDR
jgi:hypothetical protein